MLKNIKVKKLIILSMGLLLFIMIVMGVYSISSLENIASKTETLYDRPHTNLIGMWTIKAKVSQTSSELKDAYLSQLEVRNEAIQNITEVSELIRIIETNKVNPTSKPSDDMVAITQAIDDWGKSAQDIIDFMKNSSDSNNAAKLFKEYYTNERSVIDKIDKIIATASQNALNFKNDSRSVSQQVTIALIIIVVVSILATAAVLFLILKSISRPMQVVLNAARDIANGNINTKIDYSSKSEFGELADSFKSMQIYLMTVVNDIDYVLYEIGNGNFSVHTKINYMGDFAPLQKSMHNIVVNLSTIMTSINQSSNEVASGSDQVSNGAQMLSQGTTQQAGSIQELSATINEISNQVKNNAQNAIEASHTADAMGHEMEESNTQMQELITAISEINDASAEIGKIIKTIEDIAFQTNILALNAAVEAARAGSAGKGFAVVADEVRNLASKSAQASKSTSSMIENSLNAVSRGTKMADSTAKSLLTSVESAKLVAVTIDKISSASNEQSNSISQITLGIEQISAVVQTNSATAEESAAASEQLSAQAQILKGLVDKFTLMQE